MKKIFVTFILVLAGSVFAAPVYRMPVVRIQPNGDTLHLFVTGDEYYHRLHDADDYTIVQHPQTGWWVYAAKSGERKTESGDKWDVVATDYAAGSVDPATVGLTPNVGVDRETWEGLQKRYNVPEWAAVPRPKTSGRNHGTLNNIVVFIRFADDEEIATPIDRIDTIFNDSSETSISMYSYFKTVSYNKINIRSNFFPIPSGNNVISYQDSLPRYLFMPYNAATNPRGYQDFDERSELEFSLLERALNYVNANSPIPSELNLDMDNDGNVDNVCFIVKGATGDWDELLWPHKWSLYDREVFINGKRVYDFNLMLEGANERNFSSSTFCHEMFHTLGAPDLYRYYDNSTDPIGTWDIMGSNTIPPQSMGAYMKWKFGNWIDSIPEITEPGTYTIHSVGDTNYSNCCYKIATEDPHQWYVLEYRDYNNRFEQTLPGRGLLIYRINDYFMGNSGYDGISIFDEVYLFRPGGTSDHISGFISKAFFSANAGRVTFDASTDPKAMLTGNIVDSSILIYDISAPGETISFSYAYGNRCYVPKNPTTSSVRNAKVKLQWDADAPRYHLQWRVEGSSDIVDVYVNTTEYTLVGLENNSSYQWRVRSICSDGDSSPYCAWMTFQTLSCATPTQVEIAKGDAATISLPLSTMFVHSYTQMVFSADEMSGEQSIEKVAFKYGNSALTSKRNCTMYIGHTEKNEFAEASLDEYVPFGAMQKVYEGGFVFESGWNEIMLDSVFEYDGTSNLVLCVYDLSEWISEVSSFSATKTGDRFTSIVAVGNNDLVAEDSSTFYSLSNQKMRCDIRFIGCSENGNEIIAQISDEEPMVTVNHSTVTVDDTKCRVVELYDITGRRIAASAGKANSRLMAPSSGVYLLRIDGLPAKKLIIL